MRYVLLILVLFVGCKRSTDGNSVRVNANEKAAIEQRILDYHKTFSSACDKKPVNIDSLVNGFYDSDIHYVTAWGVTESLESTRTRLNKFIPKVTFFDYKIDDLTVSVHGDFAYAFFILRQTYLINDTLLDETLPTTYMLEHKADTWKVVHMQRSADMLTLRRYVQQVWPSMVPPEENDQQRPAQKKKT